MKKYSRPSIYPKIIEKKPLSEFTAAEKKHLTRKNFRWYIHYSYQDSVLKNNDGSPKMTPQTPIYYNINRKFKDFDSRYKWIKKYRKSVEDILKKGHSPYESEEKEKQYTTESALKFVLDLKKLELKPSSISDYQTRLNDFLKYLEKRSIHRKSITLIDKKIINAYLNDVLRKTSPRNRNNTKSVLSALFTKLVKEDFIENNFIKDLDVLKSEPQKNTAFTQNEVKKIFKHLKQKDVWMYYFCAHVYYGLFRNIEVVRINISDINLPEKLIKSSTKTGRFYKQLPNILIDEVYSNIDLSKYPPNYSLFTKFDEPEMWYSGFKDTTGNKKVTDEGNRRSYWGKRFTKVARKPLGFSEEYTIYSLRHSAIGTYFLNKLNKYRSEKIPNFEEKALDAVRSVTLHKSNDVVKNYLREIGYYKIEDWSDVFK